MPTAAVLLYDGCTIAECIEAATRLGNNGVDVVWTSPTGSDVQDQSGLHLTVKRAIADLDPSSLDVLVVPGGDPGSVMGHQAVQRLVQAVSTQGVVAAICAGVLVLADAGVLSGRLATHNYRAPWAPPEVEQHVHDLFAGVLVEADRSVGVVVDGRVITALPNATAEFAIAVCQAAGIYDHDRGQLLTRHLQGEFVPALFADDPALPSASSVSVRSATAADIDELIELQIQLFEQDAGVHERFADITWPGREGRSDFEALLTSPDSLVLVADDGCGPCGFLVGYLSASSPTRQPVTYAVLRSLFVREAQRDQQFGSALTQAFVEWARSRGAAEAHVNAYAANAGAQRFYEQHGFRSHSIQRTLPLTSPSEQS